MTSGRWQALCSNSPQTGQAWHPHLESAAPYSQKYHGFLTVSACCICQAPQPFYWVTQGKGVRKKGKKGGGNHISKLLILTVLIFKMLEYEKEKKLSYFGRLNFKVDLFQTFLFFLSVWHLHRESETYQGQCGPGQKPSWAGLPLNGEVRLSCQAALLGQDYLQLKHGQVVTTLNTFWDNL